MPWAGWDFSAQNLAGANFSGATLTAAGDPFRSGAEETIRRIHQSRSEALEAAGFNEPRIMVELPEAPAVKDVEKTVHEELGSNVSGNLAAFVRAHPETMAVLDEAGATEQELQDAAEVVEAEVAK